ncbi:hypothetical protein LCGC14_3136330, partial [marine sediment metagenome]
DVYVDLDGTLIYYTRFKDMEGRLGKPRPGAREFLMAIRKSARVIIYTARLCERYFSEAALRKIGKHLQENSLPYDEIYVGRGKPLCAAFVGDKNIEIPQNPVEADYDEALIKVRRELEDA